MADLDPRQIAQSGVDPTTGSPLSKEARKALFRGAQISTIIPSGGGALAIRPQQKLVDDEQNLLIIKNTKSDESLQQQINRLREEIAILSAGLANIGNILQVEGTTEKNRLLQEQEQERRYAESNIRVGAESQLEQKIQSALIAPVTALQAKVENIFGRVGSALTTLFLGWLGVQGLKAIKSYVDNDIKKLTDIKNSVLKNVGATLAGLGAIRTGFSLVTSSIKAVTFNLAKLIAKGITLPFKAAGAGAAALTGKGFKMPKVGMPKLPGLGVVGKGLGRLLTPINLGISAYRFSQGDIVGGSLSAASAIPIIGLPAIGVDIAREFGAFEGTPLGKNEGTSSAQTPPKPPAPAAANVKPQTPAKPALTSANANTKPQSTPSQPKQPPPPASELKSQPSQKSEVQPQIPLNPESPAFNFNVDNQNQFSFTENPLNLNDTTESDGFDYVDMKSSASTESPSLEKPSSSTPMQIQSLKPETNVGRVPEAKPNIVYRRIGESPSQQPVSSSNGPLTDVPLIGSSNPDNFYTLYSQLQYNVIT